MRRSTLIGILAFGVAAAAGAAPSPEAKCEAAKNAAAGAYALCLQNAHARLVATGSTAKYDADVAKCDAAREKRWEKAEAAAIKKGTSCPTSSDGEAIGDFVAAQSTVIADALAAGGALPVCGDGALNVAGEQCDTAELGSTTCASFGYETGQLACDGGCRFDASACGNPCADAGGLYVAGECFFIADAPGVSCDALCAARGFTCDEVATRSYAGSDGTLAHCQELADLLQPQSAPHVGFEGDLSCMPGAGEPAMALGCGQYVDIMSTEGSAVRGSAPATTCAANGQGNGCVSGLRRICACE
jgi:hypothetical protein